MASNETTAMSFLSSQLPRGFKTVTSILRHNDVVQQFDAHDLAGLRDALRQPDILAGRVVVLISPHNYPKLSYSRVRGKRRSLCSNIISKREYSQRVPTRTVKAVS